MKRLMAVGVLALALPWLLTLIGQEYYVAFASRVLITAIAAISLNLILGYGGMVSFGHAAYFGAGAYTAALLASSGVQSVWLQLISGAVVATVLAVLFGWIALRTKGVYFIMITLALAQMLYYLAVSSSALGGEDGLRFSRAPLWGELTLSNDNAMYYLALAAVAVSMFLLWRLSVSRFGAVLMAARDNPVRTAALGYTVPQFQLTAFVLGGTMAGVAGVLMAQLSGFANPSLLSWHTSGQLMMMVILGGVGTLWSGVLGAVVLLGLEEWLGELSEHWQLYVGVFLLSMMLFAPKGLGSVLDKFKKRGAA